MSTLSPYGPVVATDNFTRASLGSDWAQLETSSGTFDIVSDNLEVASGTGISVYTWVGAGVGTFNPSQYSSVTLPAFGDGTYNVLGPAVLINATSKQFYWAAFWLVDGHLYIQKRSISSWIGNIADKAYTYTAGDIITLVSSVLDSTHVLLTLYVNGAVFLTGVDTVSPLTTGVPGIVGGYYDATKAFAEISSWTGGNTGFLQSNYAQLGASDPSPVSTAFLSNNTAGSLLVAFAKVNTWSAGTWSITDTAGNVWVNVLNNQHNTSIIVLGGLSVWYCLSSKGGANTVTVNFTGSGYAGLMLGEFSGSFVGLDATANQQSGGSTIITSGDAAMTHANNLLVEFFAESGNYITPNDGSCFDILSSDYYNLTQRWSGSAGNYTATATVASSQNLGMILGFYQAQSMFTGVPNSLMLMGCGT